VSREVQRRFVDLPYTCGQICRPTLHLRAHFADLPYTFWALSANLPYTCNAHSSNLRCTSTREGYYDFTSI
jgi:hypothetical protein